MNKCLCTIIYRYRYGYCTIAYIHTYTIQMHTYYTFKHTIHITLYILYISHYTYYTYYTYTHTIYIYTLYVYILYILHILYTHTIHTIYTYYIRILYIHTQLPHLFPCSMVRMLVYSTYMGISHTTGVLSHW